MAWARAHAAVIASSSAPISTSRPSTACRFSSLGPNRTMQWKSVRASRRLARSTNRRWVASGAELAVARTRPAAEPEPGIPGGVVGAGARAAPESSSPIGALGSIRSPATLEVGVHRLARDEQPHDLARALEDQVDAVVAHHPLDRHRAARRGCGGCRPSRSRGRPGSGACRPRSASRPRCSTSWPSRPRAGCRRRPGRPCSEARSDDRLHREGVGRHPPDLLGDRVVLARSAAPHCTRSAAHRRDDLERALGAGHRRGGSVSRPVLSVIERELEALALAPEHVLERHLHVGEADDAVLERLEAHEVERCTTSTPGQSVSTMKAVIFFGPGARHDDEQLGDGAVGAPELLAVEDVVLPSSVSVGGGAHGRRVASRRASR